MQTQPTTGRTLVKTGTPGVYRRGSRYVVVFTDAAGKQRKRAARTLAEARAVRAELVADVQRGEYRPQSRVRFDEYARTWLDTYGGRTARGGLRTTTRREYERYARQAAAYFGRRYVGAIEPRDVRQYAVHLLAQGLARNSVRNAVGALRVLLATAVDDGLLRVNPAAGLRLPVAPQAAAPGGDPEPQQ